MKENIKANLQGRDIGKLIKIRTIIPTKIFKRTNFDLLHFNKISILPISIPIQITNTIINQRIK